MSREEQLLKSSNEGLENAPWFCDLYKKASVEKGSSILQGPLVVNGDKDVEGEFQKESDDKGSLFMMEWSPWSKEELLFDGSILGFPVDNGLSLKWRNGIIQRNI